MIIFDLACQQNHRFEGWFQSAQDFDAQLARSMIACPHCASLEVRRVPSVLHLGQSSHEAAWETRSAHAVAPSAPSAPSVQPFADDGLLKTLAACRQLISTAINKAEDVGPDFAKEVRKIHYCEAPERSIRGQATADDYEALLDEGIDVMPLPRLTDD